MRATALLALLLAVGIEGQTAEEAALGKALMAEMERRYKPFDDHVVSEYVNAVARRLATAAGLAYPLTVRLVRSEEKVAASFPGGYLALSSGAIRFAESESELAGLMAHQIAHLAARHGVSTAAPGASAMTPLIFAGGWNGICGRMDDRVSVPAAWRQKSSKLEAEADVLARGYLEKAAYDSAGLDTFFQRLK